MLKINKNLLLKFFFLLLGLLFSVAGFVQPVFAQLPITPTDIKHIQRTEYYRDPENPEALASCGAAQVGDVGKLFMIGDSITQGAASDLRRRLSESGADVTIDGLSSRRLSSGNEPEDGLSVLEDSAEIIQESEVIIVALGTNSGLTNANVNQAIDSIKNINEDAKIFWVNVYADNTLRSSSLPYTTWNQTLLDVAGTRGFFIIDWAAKASDVIANAAGGRGLELFKDDGLGVHPNYGGNEIFALTVANSIFSSNSAVGGCSTNLVGADNPEKVWNYMISKGLEPFQAAGFMGNMQAEAGFEPRRTEYAWSDPPHLSDTVPPCANDKCQPGYGIVQWTAKGRKDGLQAFSQRQGKIAGDLGLQLEYVWVEINGACCDLKASFRQTYGDVTVLEALKQTETVEEATDLILRNYEIPANMDAAYRVRIGFANSWLVRFGSGGGN